MISFSNRRCGVIFIAFALALPGAGSAIAQTTSGPGIDAGKTGHWTDAFRGYNAGDPGHWRLVASPYTHHWRYSGEHKDVYALGAEHQHDNGWLEGLSLFRNSFGQPSGYGYIGRKYSGLLGQDPLFVQWSAGVLYGYVGKYRTKVPLNYRGFAPGAVLSAGWQFNRAWSVQGNLLGDAGVMLQLSLDLQ